MKQLITVLAFAVAAFASSAYAADAASAPKAKAASAGASAAASAPTKQQTKMGSCSADFKATGKPGSERQAFMTECLKKESDARKVQQEKMKTCNADAKGKKGDERKAFMKECLSK